MNITLTTIISNRLRQLQVTFTLAARSDLAPGQQLNLALPGHHTLMLPLSGSMMMQADSLSEQAVPGRIYYIPTGTRQAFQAGGSGFSCWWIRFTMDPGSEDFFRMLKLPLSALVQPPRSSCLPDEGISPFE